jgi:hypothetical protein
MVGDDEVHRAVRQRAELLAVVDHSDFYEIVLGELGIVATQALTIHAVHITDRCTGRHSQRSVKSPDLDPAAVQITREPATAKLE